MSHWDIFGMPCTGNVCLKGIPHMVPHFCFGVSVYIARASEMEQAGSTIGFLSLFTKGYSNAMPGALRQTLSCRLLWSCS